MKPTLEQQVAALERSHRRTQAAAGVVFAAALALLVVGAPIAMAGRGLESGGAIVNGAAISPSSISVTGDITLGNVSTSTIKAGSNAYLRMDDAIGVFLQYAVNNYMLMDASNIEFNHVNGKLIVTGDTTAPAKPAFSVTPQDAQPTGANVVGDMYVTSAGLLKICTVAGTPGTWVSVGAQ